jgi:hypothetical protein
MMQASYVEQWCREFEQFFAPVSTIQSPYTVASDIDQNQRVLKPPEAILRSILLKCIDDICKGSMKMAHILDQARTTRTPRTRSDSARRLYSLGARFERPKHSSNYGDQLRRSHMLVPFHGIKLPEDDEISGRYSQHQQNWPMKPSRPREHRLIHYLSYTGNDSVSPHHI